MNDFFKALQSESFVVSPYPVGRIANKTVWRSALLLIRHSKYSSYRLLFRQFCPLGKPL